MRTLFGQPLIGIAVECGRKCPELDAMAVSTDDTVIAETARTFGAVIPCLRPQELAGHTTPKWSVFRHLVDEWERRYETRVEILVDLDLCVPLREPEDITRCIRKLRESAADVVITAFIPHRNPYFNMVEPDRKGGYRIVKSPDSIVHNRQEAPVVYGLSPAVYAIRREVLDRFEHWSQAVMEIVEIPRRRAWDIDEEMDLKVIEAMAGWKNDDNRSKTI